MKRLGLAILVYCLSLGALRAGFMSTENECAFTCNTSKSEMAKKKCLDECFNRSLTLDDENFY